MHHARKLAKDDVILDLVVNVRAKVDTRNLQHKV
jgi:hypothetical protein